MQRLILTAPQLRPAFELLLPIGLWGLLFFSIGPGDPADILNPGSPFELFQGLRAVLPIVAACVAVVIIGFGMLQRLPAGFGFLGPLGLTTVYGLAGIISIIKSPDGGVALWWTALYLSVPIVLWGALWGPNPLEQVRRLIGFTWLLVILAALTLVAIAAIYLDFIDKITNPSLLLQCQEAQWFDFTSGRIRSTGVGRYAAIAGIIAISGLWQTKWRPGWALMLLVFSTLLLYTGARGSFAGFAGGAGLVLAIYLITAGKRAVLVASLVGFIAVGIIWGTGTHSTFLESCVVPSRSVAAAPSAASTATATIPSVTQSSEVTLEPSQTVEGITAAIEQQPPDGGLETDPTSPTLTPSTGLQSPTQQATVQVATEDAPAGKTGETPIPTALPEKTPVQTLTKGQADKEQPADGEHQDGGSTPGALLENTPQPEKTPVQTLTKGQADKEQPADGEHQDGGSTPETLAFATPPQEDPVNSAEQTTAAASDPDIELDNGLMTGEFFQFSGRKAVWSKAWGLFKDSPAIGHGFQADRLLLGTHLHNSILHSLLQTGLLGAIPFLAAVILGWILFLRIILKITAVAGAHRHLVIQCGGVLAFLTLRSFPESTGAFFGVDWLILAIVLVYLQMVNYGRQPLEFDN